jgi:hypothetical protein
VITAKNKIRESKGVVIMCNEKECECEMDEDIQVIFQKNRLMQY